MVVLKLLDKMATFFIQCPTSTFHIRVVYFIYIIANINRIATLK